MTVMRRVDASRGAALRSPSFVSIIVAALVLVSAGMPEGSIRAGEGEEESAFGIGRPFPALIFPSAEDGRPMSLAQFRGRKVLLHVFASW